MGTGSFPGVKRPERGVDHPPPSSDEVKKRVRLYLYTTSGPSWPVIGWTLLTLAYLHHFMHVFARKYFSVTAALMNGVNAYHRVSETIWYQFDLRLRLERDNVVENKSGRILRAERNVKRFGNVVNGRTDSAFGWYTISCTKQNHNVTRGAQATKYRKVGFNTWTLQAALSPYLKIHANVIAPRPSASSNQSRSLLYTHLAFLSYFLYNLPNGHIFKDFPSERVKYFLSTFIFYVSVTSPKIFSRTALWHLLSLLSYFRSHPPVAPVSRKSAPPTER